MDLITVDDIDLKDKTVLMRVDLNISFDENFEITDDTRIKRTIPTIEKVLSEGGRLILMSHLGRPKGEFMEKYSLSHVVPKLEELSKRKVRFAKDCVGEEAEKELKQLKEGEILLLENLRFHKEEKEGDEDFARQLASLADVFVNDAFGVVHRAHASNSVITKYFSEGNKAFGYLIKDELDHINAALNSSERPVRAVIGGAKVSDKINIILQLLDKVDDLLIGGAMAYTFIRAEGGRTGGSLVEEDKVDLVRSIREKAEMTGTGLHLPKDTIIADEFSNDANIDQCPINDIPDDWMGMDIGPETISEYSELVKSAKTILWNGPMGVFEMSNFSKGTLAVAEATAEATDGGAFSLIGGGDSLSAINKFGLRNRVSFVSTGGGAMLEYLEGKELPGLQAIMDRSFP